MSNLSKADFDPTLDKYRTTLLKPVAMNRINHSHQRERESEMNLGQLWEKYLEYKKSSLKPTTFNYLTSTITPLVFQVKDKTLKDEDALEVKSSLESFTTIYQTKRALTYLSAACKWGKRFNLVDSNPFAYMAKETPKFKYQEEPQANAFTEEEMKAVIEAFRNHQGNFNGKGYTGCKYSFYVNSC